MEIVKVVHAEEEGNGEEPRGDESNGNGAHDGDGDHSFRAIDLFGKVCSTIEAGEGVICVDQADYESDSILRPAGIVYEIGEDEPRILVRCRLCRDRDQYNEERNQGSGYGYLGYHG